MDPVRERFDKGVAELSLYLKLLRSIETRSTPLRFSTSNADECLRILKAGTFLVIYNVVEAGVRAAFDDLYAGMVASGAKYADVIDELRNEWLGQSFRELTPESANKQTYMEKTQELLRLVSSSAVLELSARRMTISGNLDAELIRQLCRKHNVRLQVHRRALGGVELKTVKDQRNALAHGHITFAECGREFTVADLERISNQTAMFIRGFVGSIKRYKDRSSYRT